MPTPTKGRRLGGSPAHEKLMLANLATDLFQHGRITTTETKARRLRPYAERLITKARRGDLHARRQVMKVIRDKSVVHVLLTEIGPRFSTRPGGYTRITKIGPRKGDNAPMAVIELVQEEYVADARTATTAAATATPSAAAAPAGGSDEASTAGGVTAVEDASAVNTSAEETAAEEQQSGVEHPTVEHPAEEQSSGEPAEDEQSTRPGSENA